MPQPEAPEKTDESGLEQEALRWLGNVGWQIGAYDDIERSEAKYLDEEYDRGSNEVIYWDLLRDKLLELNDFLVDDDVDDVISSLKRDLRGDNLIDQNRHFYKILRKGKKVSVPNGDGGTETKYADLIDFDHPSNNSLIAVNQFNVRKAHRIIPDLVLLVNGIPLVMGELKSTPHQSDWENAYSDLKEYERLVPEAFVPVLFNVAMDSFDYRAGAVGVNKKFYLPWSEAPEKYREDQENKQAVKAMLNPDTLLDILGNFVFYERQAGGDVKIIPRHMQYYATQRILDRLRRDEHDTGLYWHAQGSGKSYTMLYLATILMNQEKIEPVVDNPQIILIVDTDKLRRQMSDDLEAVGIEQSTVATSGKDLQKKIKDGKSQVILTTIHMFENVDADIQGNPNTVLLIDEAHRYMEQNLGNQMEAALPDAYHFAFTGTPVRESERDTFDTYCPPGEEYHHRYSMKQGMHDDVILPVIFSPRHKKEWLYDEELLNQAFDRNIGDVQSMTYEERDKLIKELVTKTDLAELRPRVQTIVEDIVDHFAEVEKNNWKGMVVTPSRKAAALYGEELMKYRDPEDVEVMISDTEARDDEDDTFEPFMEKFYTTPEERDGIVERFKNEDQPRLLVVCNMLLTGFDAPDLKVMYLDRYLTNHNLLQAIARTNRPKEGKKHGEIVDYQGVFQEIDKALEYDSEVRDNAAIDRDEEIEEFIELLDETMQIFEGIEKTNSSETLHECMTLLTKNEDLRKQFENDYKSLRDQFESLSPDDRLGQVDVQQKYGWLNQVWVAYQREFNRDDRAEDDLKAKTKEILEEQIDIGEIDREFPVLKIGEEHLEQIEGLGPSARATEIQHAVTEHIQDHRNTNPRYENLSERVDDILTRWESGQIDDPRAAEEFEQVERDIIDVEQQPEQREMTPAEYAIEELLKQDYEHHLKGDHSAEEIARAIGEAFQQEVDTSYEGWKENPETRRQIRQTIIQTIVKDLDQPGLYHADKFVDQVRDYLIENAE
ncbi:MAG: type I restriction endonuclease subunit R [bacterium]